MEQTAKPQEKKIKVSAKILALTYYPPWMRSELNTLYWEFAPGGVLYVVYPKKTDRYGIIKWEMQSKQGYGLPFEQQTFDTPAELEEHMREVEPDLRKWKKRTSVGAWWLY
jgi:hypothetical protein